MGRKDNEGMINPAKLTEEDKGAWIVYTTPHGITEVGRIKSWNFSYIFIVYKYFVYL